MNFLEEIKEIQNDRDNKENIVVNEILDYFKEKMETYRFKANIKERIKDAINKGDKKCILQVEFWEYHSGCSNTYIYVGGCGKFEISEEKNGSNYKYKEIELEKIHKRICSKLNDMLIEKLEELGLKIINSKRRDNDFRFNYYKNEVTISWE